MTPIRLSLAHLTVLDAHLAEPSHAAKADQAFRKTSRRSRLARRSGSHR